MELVILPDGQARTVYQEHVDLSALGSPHIQRASHVEPDAQGRWWADLGLVGGPMLGPHEKRKDAVVAEIVWIQRNVLADL